MVRQEWNTFHLCTSVCCSMIQRKGVHTLSCRNGSLLSSSRFHVLQIQTCCVRLQRCNKIFFFFSFCKAEGSSTVDWVIKMKSHPHWFILTHRCRAFELRWASTVPPAGLLSSDKLGQAFEYSWSSMTTSRYSVSGPMLIPGFAHLSPLETLYLPYWRFGVLLESVRWL